MNIMHDFFLWGEVKSGVRTCFRGILAVRQPTKRALKVLYLLAPSRNVACFGPPTASAKPEIVVIASIAAKTTIPVALIIIDLILQLLFSDWIFVSTEAANPLPMYFVAHLEVSAISFL